MQPSEVAVPSITTPPAAEGSDHAASLLSTAAVVLTRSAATRKATRLRILA
jgi:hypothetical protein